MSSEQSTQEAKCPGRLVIRLVWVSSEPSYLSLARGQVQGTVVGFEGGLDLRVSSWPVAMAALNSPLILLILAALQVDGQNNNCR